MPFPESEGFFVQPGTISSVAIRKKTIERLGKVDHTIYTAKYSDCIDVLNWNVEEFAMSDSYTSTRLAVAYSRNGCINTCIQKEVMEKCKAGLNELFSLISFSLTIQCYDYNYPSEGRTFNQNITGLCSYSNKDQCKLGISNKAFIF